MKTCSKCAVEKDISEFNKNKSKKLGVASYCKLCFKVYRDQHYQDNKKSYSQSRDRNRKKYLVEFFDFLKTKSCVDCGNTDYRVLEFDHLRDKKYNISQRCGDTTLKNLMKEIDKCEVVCANCHRIRTATRGDFYSYLLE